MAEFSAAEAPTANRIQLRHKLLAYVAIWIAALIATAPGMWPLAYMFPLGLVAVFNRHLANDGGWGIFIGCYVVYILHGFFYFRSKTTLKTAILYGVLVNLLLSNVAGCREMIHTH